MASFDTAFNAQVLSLGDEVGIFHGTPDPSTGIGQPAPVGSFYLRMNGETFSKVGPLDTDWLKSGAGVAELGDFANAVYVAKHGNDANDGRTPDKPKLTVLAGVNTALGLASAIYPVSVHVMSGIYDEINPILVNSPYVCVMGCSGQFTTIRPTVNGQPVFRLQSSISTIGASVRRLKVSGNSTYRSTPGSSAFRFEGDGRFWLDFVHMDTVNAGLDTGYGTITGEQRIITEAVSIHSSEFGVRSTASSIVLFNNGTVCENTESFASYDTSNIIIKGWCDNGSFSIIPAGKCLVARGASKIDAHGGNIRSLVKGVETHDTSMVHVLSTQWDECTTDIHQVSGTSSLSVSYGHLERDKVILTNEDNVSLGYFDEDSGDFFVGKSAVFRVRQSDGRIGVGDSLTDARMDANGVGGARSISLIDTNGNIRVWRFVDVVGEDPSIEFVKGTGETPATAGNLWWDIFVQDGDMMVFRRRTGGGGGDPDERLRMHNDYLEILRELRLPDGTAADPQITFTTDLDTGVYRISENTLGISTGGVERLRVQSNGVVSVQGTTNYETLVAADDDIPNVAYLNNRTGSMQVSTISGQPVPTYVDSTRANKRLSIESQMFSFSRATAADLDWFAVGPAIDADSGFIMPLNGTITMVTGHCENATSSKDIQVYVDGTPTTVGTFPLADNSTFVNTTLNTDFNAGQRIRIRAGTVGGTIADTVVNVWVKWRAA